MIQGVHAIHCYPCQQDLTIDKSNRFANINRHLTTPSHMCSVSEQEADEPPQQKFKLVQDKYPGVFIRKDKLAKCREYDGEINLKGKMS